MAPIKASLPPPTIPIRNFLFMIFKLKSTK